MVDRCVLSFNYSEGNELDILFLGTAAVEGWPGLFCECQNCQQAQSLGGKNIRTRASLLINRKYMINCNPDAYHHFLRENLEPSKIEHIFITHPHEDHFLPFNLKLRRPVFAHIQNPQPLHVYGNHLVVDMLKEMQGELEKGNIVLHKVKPFQAFVADVAKVVPLKADHGADALLYHLQLSEKGILIGYDTGIFPEETWEKLSQLKVDVAILDCTNGGISSENKYHMGIDGILETKNRLRSIGSANDQTVFVATHFSHNGGLLHPELCKELEPEGFIVAFDGMRLKI